MTTKTPTPTELPPFPRLGELYRSLALALDTKNRSNVSPGDIDRLAREGEYDWTLLPALCKELVTEPLTQATDADFAAEVEAFVRHVHTDYLGLVATISLDALSRAQALPLLIEHYFSALGYDLLARLHHKFGGPPLSAVLDTDNTSIKVVLDWAANEGCTAPATPLSKRAYPGTTDADKAGRDKVNRWMANPSPPDMGSIRLFLTALKNQGFTAPANLQRWLVVARALTWLEQKSPIPLRQALRPHQLTGAQGIDIGALLSHAVQRESERFSALKLPVHMLHHALKRTTPKLIGDKARTEAELTDVRQLIAQHDPQGRTQFHLDWLHGRWHVLAGELAQALPFYERAAELANYRGGEHQKKITEEAIVIAACLGDKPCMKRLKHRAIAFGLFAQPSDGVVVEDWEIEQFRQQFHPVFPAEGRFPEAAEVPLEEPTLPFLQLTPDYVESLTPNLRKPDQVIQILSEDGQTRRWPQLQLFASFGRLTHVTRLLERGASVDKLGESNGSALLRAIQHAENTGEREVLDLLLKQVHSGETLNAATTQQQRTPLMCAIDYGAPDVVAQLLTMGAKADKRLGIDRITPLYHCMGKLALVKSPNKLVDHMQRTAMATPDAMQREVRRRNGGHLTGVFGDKNTVAQMMEIPAYRAIFDHLVDRMVAQYTHRHSMEKLLQIIRSLLKHGANPNTPHDYRIPGCTPMMLAAEYNDVAVLQLMLQHGGNPDIKDKKGSNCMAVARAFSSGSAIEFLKSTGMRWTT